MRGEGNRAKIEEASVLLAKLLKAEQTPPPGASAATSSTGTPGEIPLLPARV